MKKYNTLLPILLSVSLSTTSCASNSVFVSTTNPKPQFIQEESVIEEETMDPLTEEYYNYYRNLEFPYNHIDKYLSHEEIDELSVENSKVTECSYKFDGDFSKIVEEIRENSNNNEFFTQENINILTRLLKTIYNNSASDKNEDFHKISTIKICYGNGDDLGTIEDSDVHYVAYFDEETNTLYLDKEYIKLIASQEVVSYNYYLEYDLAHELDHVRQVLCDCNKDIKNTKFSYGEYISFMLESTAESSIYNELDRSYKISYAYPEERIKEGEILLLGLFDNSSIDKYYESIYDVNLEELYSYMDLTDEEVYDFYNIVYSIDGSLCRNNLPYEIFGDVKNITYGDLKKEIGYAYKQNLFKMIIMRLLKYNSSNEISLEDNLAIYYLIKNLIFYDCYYFEEIDDKIVRVYPEEIESLFDMDNKYLEYLANRYHKSIDEIKEMEKLDGYLGCYSLVNYVQTGEIPYDTYKKQVERLLEEFPTITNIIANYTDIYLSSYSSAVKQLSLTD